jgi:hypothetical protein
VSQSHTQHSVLYCISIVLRLLESSRHTLYNRVNWAALLAETAVDALGHIDIVASGPPAAVHTLLGLDCDGLCRTDGFAELASNAALLACGVPSESVFASEAG